MGYWAFMTHFTELFWITSWARKSINFYCLFAKSINVLQEEISSVTHRKLSCQSIMLFLQDYFFSSKSRSQSQHDHQAPQHLSRALSVWHRHSAPCRLHLPRYTCTATASQLWTASQQDPLSSPTTPGNDSLSKFPYSSQEDGRQVIIPFQYSIYQSSGRRESLYSGEIRTVKPSYNE